MSRAFEVPTGQGKNVSIKICEPELRAQGLSLTTWTSSFVLARQLHTLDVQPSHSTSLPVLELGAGTGLVGLTAAAVWKTHVCSTDLAPLLPGIAANIALNLDCTEGRVDCGSLDWDSPELLKLENGSTLNPDNDPASVILAADTIYSEEHPELLSKTILRWLAPGPSARVIIAYPLRVAYLDYLRELWELLEAGGLEAFEEGKEQADVKDWDDECLIEWCVWRWK
ncbi:hypothetical protein PV08_00605 [Exophiala spinifera]|uniref:Uncharacterized protein n=1 Tax=Exophiala spinifera TaxID=91928 RepID=A0A0D2BND4_9EURO|nr:uncharacterized protein PV08_00605 [Exophiala spinifera]KIW20030.1 hypothetical protein PV08_00605 [Exophiala spinifera]